MWTLWDATSPCLSEHNPLISLWFPCTSPCSPLLNILFLKLLNSWIAVEYFLSDADSSRHQSTIITKCRSLKAEKLYRPMNAFIFVTLSRKPWLIKGLIVIIIAQTSAGERSSKLLWECIDIPLRKIPIGYLLEILGITYRISIRL